MMCWLAPVIMGIYVLVRTGLAAHNEPGYGDMGKWLLGGAAIGGILTICSLLGS